MSVVAEYEKHRGAAGNCRPDKKKRVVAIRVVGQMRKAGETEQGKARTKKRMEKPAIDLM